MIYIKVDIEKFEKLKILVWNIPSKDEFRGIKQNIE